MWPSQDSFPISAHLFKVNLNISEYILELLDNSEIKINCQLILLRDTIAVYPTAVQKDADILKVTVATALCKHSIKHPNAGTALQELCMYRTAGTALQ